MTNQKSYEFNQSKEKQTLLKKGFKANLLHLKVCKRLKNLTVGFTTECSSMLWIAPFP